MFNQLFQEELSTLRERGSEFAKAHPSIAPLLSVPPSDPDVERLLEGTAFLTALLREKLDDEFPEIIHDLLSIVAPQFLQPVPAATILTFQPKPTLKGSLTLPAGTHVASTPVDAASCLFQTCFETRIHPLTLTAATLAHIPGQTPVLVLCVALNGISLSQWTPGALRIHLADSYPQAADLYLLLREHLKRIVLIPHSTGDPCVLSPRSLRPVGFGPESSLIPYPVNAFPGFRCVQEYFQMPEKFLFFDLVGWEQWRNRGTGATFEVRFELDDRCAPPLRFHRDSLVLNATPAINLFPHDADPVILDHTQTHYPLRPAGRRPEHFQIHSVAEVKGFIQGTTEERRYRPFEGFGHGTEEGPVYHLTRKRSLSRAGIDLALSPAYPKSADAPRRETLSVRLLCTNGALPERLSVGDIRLHADETPETVTFRNILPPRPGGLPPIGRQTLARLHSLLAANVQSLERLDTLRASLALLIYPDAREDMAAANRRRIDGLQALRVTPEERLFRGSPLRGRAVDLDVREDHFAGRGDLYLFGCVLDAVFASHATVNSFTRLTINDINGGQRYQWAARTGNLTLF